MRGWRRDDSFVKRCSRQKVQVRTNQHLVLKSMFLPPHTLHPPPLPLPRSTYFTAADMLGPHVRDIFRRNVAQFVHMKDGGEGRRIGRKVALVDEVKWAIGGLVLVLQVMVQKETKEMVGTK